MTKTICWTLALLASSASRAGSSPAEKAASRTLERALVFFSSQELATMPRIEPAGVRCASCSATAEGFVVPGYPVIYVATWSATYQAAAAGDAAAVVKLAGIIAHERAHVEHGPDERQAYEAEIAMLRRCGASSALVNGVRRAMRTRSGSE